MIGLIFDRFHVSQTITFKDLIKIRMIEIALVFMGRPNCNSGSEQV